MGKLSISQKSVEKISGKISGNEDVYCSGLFFSARWFVAAAAGIDGINFIILPDRESAEYCAADLYSLVEGDSVFFLPDSGRRMERSSYKFSLSVQRTSAIGRLMEYDGSSRLFFVTYPQAIAEGAVAKSFTPEGNLLRLKCGDSIDRGELLDRLDKMGFVRNDFVGEPGQFAVRGAVIDIFSYSDSNPFRFSFFGDEIESISVFDCGTQLSKEKREEVEIYPDLSETGEGASVPVLCLLPPEKTLLWLDSSELYSKEDFYPLAENFRKVFLQVPTGLQVDDPVKFNIAPQPVFNKNFELLSADIREKAEAGYGIYVYGEKKSQLERLRSILLQNECHLPEFVDGRNIHNGFIDNEEKICCYTDHEIFDRFHRVSLRRTVERSEQLTINDLTSFSVGDYIVHIDYGVGIFGGLVRIRDDKNRMHEVVKIIYKDNDTVYVSVHSLHKISRYKSRDGEPPRIYKLGSKTWQNLKANAKSKVKDIAKDLIQLYAKRRASKGFAFSSDTFLQTELESSFIYEDTPDQEKAVQAVKRDMEAECPMDRLVCGDVGFGKTEVAVRAAFKAVADGK
ncbi:MAG: CarD family transcriptional regulator, partial [Candidatus Cryptobacteroides sp.]